MPRQSGVAPAQHILCLSANTPQALLRKQSDLLAWLRCDSDRHDLSGICAALLYGREHFAERLAVVGGTVEEMIVGLERTEAARRLRGTAPVNGEGQVIRLSGDSVPLEDLHAVAAEYVKGLDPADLKLYPGVFYAGVPLPLYPFEKTACPIGGLMAIAETMELRKAEEAANDRQMRSVLEKPCGIRLHPLPVAAPLIADAATVNDLASLIDQILEKVYEGTAEIEKIVDHMSEIAGMGRV